MKTKEEKEVYILTLKGLLTITIPDEYVVDSTLNSIELYLRRHYSKNGHPAIVLDLEDNEFHFATLNKKE